MVTDLEKMEPYLNPCFVGIDHGKRGAVGIVDERGEPIFLIDLPHLANEVDVNYLMELLKEKFPNRKILLEEVTTIYHRMKANDILSFGKNYGLLIGFFRGSGIQFDLVDSRTWNKEYRLFGKPKEASVAKARQLFPKMINSGLYSFISSIDFGTSIL